MHTAEDTVNQLQNQLQQERAEKQQLINKLNETVKQLEKCQVKTQKRPVPQLVDESYNLTNVKSIDEIFQYVE